ncbi:MAG: hypothetical protein ABJF01_15870 [bacterium]
MTTALHGSWRRLVVASALAFAGLAATACNLDKTLHVDDPDVATPGSVSSAAGLPVVYAGGRADFQNALTGVDASVTFPGLLTDELRDIDTFPTRIEVDQRSVQASNSTVQGWYRAMHLARASLERAAVAFQTFDAKNAKNAELHALDGFMYIMFAEDFCNGVAYSQFVNGNPTYGSPQTGDQSLALAVAQFDSALAIAAANSNEAYLAKVGKGRALLDKNDYAGAAAAVAGVPVDFQYTVFTSTNSTRENNGVFVNVGPQSKRYAVAEKDGANGLAFRTMGQNIAGTTGDWRVRYNQSGVGQDGQSPAFYTQKYPAFAAPVVLADGIEAQLITAENLLKGGNNQGMLDALNALRGNLAIANRVPYTQAGQTPPTALAPLADPGSADARVNMLFQERALWMYLTGHRLGDMRRLVRQYGRGAETVFPTGNYPGAAGGVFGADVNFPITIDEQNNPSAGAACLDRKA